MNILVFLFLVVSAESAPSGPKPSRRRRDLVATYEEAWDVKMSRRLGGMDVSRLAEALPNGGGGDRFRRNDLIRASDRPIRSTPSGSAAAVGICRAPSLSPVLTSTEGVVLRPRATPRVPTYRNSSNDTICNREMMVSPFRLNQNRVRKSFLHQWKYQRQINSYDWEGPLKSSSIGYTVVWSKSH